MRYKKFLIGSLIFGLCQLSIADNNPFNQGIDFANGNKPGTNMISNTIIESAVGKNNINQAVANQDSIQNTMGGSYKNINGVTNAGNSKASACIGKKTDDCKAYNFYNDPLTKQSQQGVESAVSIASNLINKKISQGVSITDYCSSHPNDSVCIMCAKNPSLSTCQSGNKCTTITYNTNTSEQTSNSCQIIGHRSYNCKKWVDNITFHTASYQCDPTNGGCNSYINNSLCQQTAPYVPTSCVTYQYSFAYGCTNWGVASCSAGGTYNYPGSCGTNGGTAACDGVTKSGKVYPSGGGPYNCNGIGCAGKDWVCTKSQGQLAQYSCKIIDNVTWKDNCNQ